MTRNTESCSLAMLLDISTIATGGGSAATTIGRGGRGGQDNLIGSARRQQHSAASHWRDRYANTVRLLLSGCFVNCRVMVSWGLLNQQSTRIDDTSTSP